MLNLEQHPQLFDGESLIHKALGQRYQYLVQMNDRKYCIIDRFREETKVLELWPIHIIIKWDTCSIVAHLLMIS